MPFILHMMLALVLARPQPLPPPLSVCDVLSRPTELRHTVVRVRGIWMYGDTGEVLVPLTPCSAPIIRGGWRWHPVLEIKNMNDRLVDPSVVESFNSYSQSQRLQDGAQVAVVTFEGKLEADDHFTIRKSTGKPIGYWSATLLRQAAGDFETIMTPHGFSEWWHEIAVKPEPVRVR